MGLDTSHDAWHGGYGSFNIWREEIAKLSGIPKLSEMEGFGGNIVWDIEHPLYALLNHSDCDGELTPDECKKTAEGLQIVYDKMDDAQFGGHIGNIKNKTKQFIDGCLLAHSLNEPIDFH